MPHPSFLTEFLFVLIAATLVAVIFERLRLPSILGFLLAGVVIGPHGFGLLTSTERVHHLAELGVVLLMLTIGLEFSFDRLKGLRRIAILGGSLQLALSIGLSLIAGSFFGWTVYQRFFFGSVIALSSTAIVFKYLIDRGEIETQYGRIAVSILLFQDLAVVPMLIFATGTGQNASEMMAQLGGALLKTVGLLAGIAVFARFILPFCLKQAAATRNREVLFLTAVAICLGTAWISGQLGLSLAIGAFFAGFMFANTDFSSHLIGEIIPYRHLFVSLFFVSIGLLFDPRFALNNWVQVGAGVGLVLVVNFVVMTLLIIFLGFPPRIALATGLILSQIGEFSFVLLEAGLASGGIRPYFYQVLLSTAFLTMFFTPFLFALVPPFLRISENIPFFGMPPRNWTHLPERRTEMSDHVILCGFGPSGKDLAVTFEKEKIPFILLEMNPAKMKEARARGIRVLYGDAANREVMRRAGIAIARAVVVSFGDPLAMAQVIRVVEHLKPEISLFVRTRYERDVPMLYELGTDAVVVEEWEASLELNRIVLESFKIPQEHIRSHLDRIRAHKELMIEEAILKQAGK